MTALTHDETSEEMKEVPDWTHQAKTIVRTYKFDGFLKSIAFVDQIAKRAQKLDHHPDITPVPLRNPVNIDDLRYRVMGKWVGVEKEPVKRAFSRRA